MQVNDAPQRTRCWSSFGFFTTSVQAYEKIVSWEEETITVLLPSHLEIQPSVLKCRSVWP